MSAETFVAFGDLLKECRRTAGLTQEALAERAGVSARNIQNLERGENKPLKDTARRLAQALGLSEREQAVGAMRAALGEELFAAAWTEGRTLSLDEAVALALEMEPSG